MGRVPIRRGGSSAPPRVIRLVHQSAAAGHPPLRRPADVDDESLREDRRVRPPAVRRRVRRARIARCSDRCGGGTRRRGRRPGTTGTRRRRRDARRFQSPNRRRKATPNGTRTPGRVSPNRDISSRCSSLGTPRRRSLEEASAWGLPAAGLGARRPRTRCFTRVSRCLSPYGVSGARARAGPCPAIAGVGAGKTGL